VLTEWRRRLEPRRRRKILAPPTAEFSTARRLKPARQPDFTAASRKRLGGAAEGSNQQFAAINQICCRKVSFFNINVQNISLYTC